MSSEKPTQAASPWERMPQTARKGLIWGLWFITWSGLIAGTRYPVFFEYVVVFSALHALLFLALFRFRIRPFPVQVRVGYLAWVGIGTYVPYMTVLMYITLAGLSTNLFLGYCPLARMMYLLPWNRDEEFSLNLLRRVFFSAPTAGKFAPQPRSA